VDESRFCLDATEDHVGPVDISDERSTGVFRVDAGICDIFPIVHTLYVLL